MQFIVEKHDGVNRPFDQVRVIACASVMKCDAI